MSDSGGIVQSILRSPAILPCSVFPLLALIPDVPDVVPNPKNPVKLRYVY